MPISTASTAAGPITSMVSSSLEKPVSEIRSARKTVSDARQDAETGPQHVVAKAHAGGAQRPVERRREEEHQPEQRDGQHAVVLEPVIERPQAGEAIVQRALRPFLRAIAHQEEG